MLKSISAKRRYFYTKRRYFYAWFLVLFSVGRYFQGVQPPSRPERWVLALALPLQDALGAFVRSMGHQAASIGRLLKNQEESSEGSCLSQQQATEELRMEFAKTRAENQRLLRLLDMKQRSPRILLAARVIHQRVSAYRRIITIDKGKVDGVLEGMAAVVPSGIVGIVYITHTHYANILPITAIGSHAAVFLSQGKTRGVISGTGQGDLLVLEYLSRGPKPSKGTLLVTSGTDGIFDSGEQVGTVLRTEMGDPRQPNGIAYVTPSAPLDSLREVLLYRSSNRPRYFQPFLP